MRIRLLIGGALVLLGTVTAPFPTRAAPAAAAPTRIASIYINAFCESCIHEAPYARREIKRRPGIQVVVVGFRMTRSETVQFARKLHYPKAWRVIGDPTGSRAKRDHVCQPTTIVVERGGHVTERIQVTYPGEPDYPPLPGC